MRILYVFPHPDDESFGPSLAIADQRRAGDDVHLLTLTRGGATSQRHRLGLSIEEMGEVRHEEMKRMADVLGLSSLTVLDFPDSGLKELDPRRLEGAVHDHVSRLRPDVLVTYAVHGVSGFPDHLVGHAVVKRVYCESRDRGSRSGKHDPAQAADHAPRRLALFTLAEPDSEGEPDGAEDESLQLRTSPWEDIDCSIEVGDAEYDRARRALDCYETYQEVIQRERPLRRVGRTVHFELFQEDHNPPLPSLTAGL